MRAIGKFDEGFGVIVTVGLAGLAENIGGRRTR